MPYTNLGGTKASYVDGNLIIPRTTNQPRILVMGPATSGRTNDVFTVVNSADAEGEFGAATPVMRGMHEAFAQNANNIAIMRTGGTRGSLTIVDSAANQLVITPSDSDDQILQRYALILENDGSANRALIYDLKDDQFVYDSDEVETINEDDIEVDGLEDLVDLFALNSRTSPAIGVDMDSLVVGDFSTLAPAVAPASVAQVAGTDGTTPTLVERYASYNSALFSLDYQDADYILPMDVYIDDENIADDVAVNQVSDPTSATTTAGLYGLFWSGKPAVSADQDKLGYLWQYVYQGRIYTYFSDVSDYFTGTATAATIAALDTDIVVTCAVGKGGNGVTVEIIDSAAGGETQSLAEAGDGTMTITIDLGGTTPNRDDLVASSNIAFASITTAGGKALSDLVVLSGGTAVAAAPDSATCAGGAGGAVLTPVELESITVPAVVTAKFAAGADAELRECNFAHQLASACKLASENWSAVHGGISFKAPPGYSRNKISDWVGSLPIYTDSGQQEYVSAEADNGSGILGNKFIAGKAFSGGGYRNGKLTDGSSASGYAYGGLIQTKGSSLPNGTTWPYGVSDADEALDENNAPVDLGKFISICGDWIIHRNSYNGGSVYRGSIAGTLLGLLAGLRDNVEPIGQQGRVTRIRLGRRIHSTQLDSLARTRVVMLRREEGDTRLTFTSGKTGAHPVDSDYTRSSTQRCVNRILQGIRTIGRPYIGRPFNAISLQALEAAVERYLQQERIDGYHSGAVAKLSYTRGSKLLGRLTVRLKMVPPGSIEAITIVTSLAADESELV